MIFKEHFQNTHAFLDKMSSPIPKSNFSCSLLICLLNLLWLFHKYSHTVPHVHQDLLYPMNFIYLFICCKLYVLSTKYVLVEVEMADNHSTHHYLMVLPSLYVMVTITYWSALFVWPFQRQRHTGSHLRKLHCGTGIWTQALRLQSSMASV